MSLRKRLQSSFVNAKKEYLKKHELCEVCLLLGREAPAVDVHHIVGRWNTDKYLDENNFVALCREHHSLEHSGDEKVKRLIDKVVERKNV